MDRIGKHTKGGNSDPKLHSVFLIMCGFQCQSFITLCLSQSSYKIPENGKRLWQSRQKIKLKGMGIVENTGDNKRNTE